MRTEDEIRAAIDAADEETKVVGASHAYGLYTMVATLEWVLGELDPRDHPFGSVLEPAAEG